MDLRFSKVFWDLLKMSTIRTELLSASYVSLNGDAGLVGVKHLKFTGFQQWIQVDPKKGFHTFDIQREHQVFPRLRRFAKQQNLLPAALYLILNFVAVPVFNSFLKTFVFILQHKIDDAYLRNLIASINAEVLNFITL